MGSYITENRKVLSQRHYIRKAGTEDYWFDFSYDKLKQYRRRFGDGFCLVLCGSDTEDDAYVVPFRDVAALFVEDCIDDRRRWVGSVVNNIIRLRKSSRSMSISVYYNAFELLDVGDEQESRAVKEPEVLYNLGNGIDLSSLRERIRMFNERYRNAAPHKRRVISEQVARPSAITDYLKRLQDFTCQICGEIGFIQRNGTRYIETHHITELHNLAQESHCSDNIIVVCANCHRKLHYAKVSYRLVDTERIVLTINGESFEFRRNIVSMSF